VLPVNTRLVKMAARAAEQQGESWYLLSRVPVVRGTDVRNARPGQDEYRKWETDFTLSQDAGKRFGRFTESNIGNRLAIIWPDRGESEVLDITQTMKRVDKYFTDADPKQLRRMFDVRAFADPDLAGTYQLDMVPKRKQIRQGLERLQLWIHRDSLTLVQMTMSFPGGDSDTIRLEDQELNAPLAPGTFDVEIPAGTKK
jgi:hypothetical protein